MQISYGKAVDLKTAYFKTNSAVDVDVNKLYSHIREEDVVTCATQNLVRISIGT